MPVWFRDIVHQNVAIFERVTKKSALLVIAASSNTTTSPRRMGFTI
jgi:hypothetical protein